MKKDYQSKFNPRQYMLSNDYEIYYYSDTYFSGVEIHSHKYYEFYFFLQGNISMQIGEQIYPLRIGDVIVIPPGIPHHLINHDKEIPYRRFVFWISQEYFENLTAASPDYAFMIEQAVKNKHYIYHNDIIELNTLQGRFFNIMEEIHSEQFGKDAMTTLLINELLLHLNRQAYNEIKPQTTKEKLNLYETLMRYIENHLEDELSLDHLAAEFYISKYHISHIFKENFGISVHQYITKKRLAMCQAALLSDTNITNTIHMYGFKDYSSFFRAFKKEYGMSPKKYKEIHELKR